MAAKQRKTLGWLTSKQEALEQQVRSIVDDPPAELVDYASAMSTLLKAKKDFKALMVANRPDNSWHKEVKSDAGVLEALVIGSFDEIEQIETSFKETRRLSQQIEDAIEGFEDLKLDLSTGDSNEQRKWHHKTLLRIIEDTGADRKS